VAHESGRDCNVGCRTRAHPGLHNAPQVTACTAQAVCQSHQVDPQRVRLRTNTH
jgi:hypothetical protein